MTPPTITMPPVRYRIDARRFEDVPIVHIQNGWHGGNVFLVDAKVPARYGNHSPWFPDAYCDRAREYIAQARVLAPGAPTADLQQVFVNPRKNGKPQRLWPGHFLRPIGGTDLYVDQDLVELCQRLTFRRAVSPDATWRILEDFAGLTLVLALADVDGKLGAIVGPHRGWVS